jgi:hypothetical protein
MAAGPALTLLRREKRRRREESSPAALSREPGRTASGTSGLPLYLRPIGDTARSETEPAEDEFELAEDNAGADVAGDNTSESVDTLPAVTMVQPPSPSAAEAPASGAGPPDTGRPSGRAQPSGAAPPIGATPALEPESESAAVGLSATPLPSGQLTPASDAPAGSAREHGEAPARASAATAVPATPTSRSTPEAGEFEPEQGDPTNGPAALTPREHAATASPESGASRGAGASGGGAPPDSRRGASRADAEPADASSAQDRAEAGAADETTAQDRDASPPGEREAAETESPEGREVGAGESDLLAAPDLPLAGAAAGHRERIDASCDQSTESIRAEATARRQAVRKVFAEKRAFVASTLAGGALAVVGFFDQKRGALTTSLMGKALALQTFALSLVNRTLAIGTGVTSAIARGVGAVTSLAVNGIGGVITGALAIAESIPIPDLPGLGRIRGAVLGVVRAATARLRNALANVQSFMTAAVASAVDLVQSLMRRAASAIIGAITGFMSLILRAIALISGRLAAIAQQVRTVIRSTGRTVNATLAMMERGAVQQIHRAESAARREIEANRATGNAAVNQILEFCYASGDYPPDGEAHPHLDVVDNAATKEDFESSALAAMAAVTTGVRLRNAGIERNFRAHTSSVFALILAAATRYMLELASQISLAFLQVVARVTQAAVEVLIRIAGVVADVLAVVGRLVANITRALDSILNAILQVVRAPVDALVTLGRSVVSGLRSFLTRLISRLVGVFSSDSDEGGDVAEGTASLTGDLDAFEVSRLKSAARMASPPALVLAPAAAGGAAIGVAAGGTAVALSTILFWVGLALLAIALIILLYLLVQHLMAQPRAVPRAPAQPKAPARPRARRRRKPKTPLRWNPSLSMGTVTASGGIPGTLDTNAKLPARAPLHAHHVWPTYVGGPVVQPLMSIRDTVHISVVHPGLHGIMKATAINMGHDITTNTTNPKNQAFIAHLHGNIADRTTFAAVMTGYYLGLNLVTSPPIPVPAYELGMTHSFPLI